MFENRRRCSFGALTRIYMCACATKLWKEVMEADLLQLKGMTAAETGKRMFVEDKGVDKAHIFQVVLWFA